MVECSICGRKKVHHQLYRIFRKTSRGPQFDRTMPPNVYCYSCRNNLGRGRVAVPIKGSRVPYKMQYKPKPKLEKALPQNLGVETIYSDSSETSMPCPYCRTINWDHPKAYPGQDPMGLYLCEKCGRTYTGYKAIKKYIEKQEKREDE